MYSISQYRHYFQYTDNDEVLTKMYRTQMNLSENIKSGACILFNLGLTLTISYSLYVNCLIWDIEDNLMISSVYFSNVELKSTEILLTEEKPDYTTSQMLRL